MITQPVGQNEWNAFLKAFTRRHDGWLVSIETHDLQTGETVDSRFMPLRSVELDLEERKNPRINVTVGSDGKEVKRILFRPSALVLQLSESGIEEGLQIVSVHTVTTVRFRIAVPPELLDGVA